LFSAEVDAKAAFDVTSACICNDHSEAIARNTFNMSHGVANVMKTTLSDSMN
jgi:hypothetical protein